MSEGMDNSGTLDTGAENEVATMPILSFLDNDSSDVQLHTAEEEGQTEEPGKRKGEEDLASDPGPGTQAQVQAQKDGRMGAKEAKEVKEVEKRYHERLLERLIGSERRMRELKAEGREQVRAHERSAARRRRRRKRAASGNGEDKREGSEREQEQEQEQEEEREEEREREQEQELQLRRDQEEMQCAAMREQLLVALRAEEASLDEEIDLSARRLRAMEMMAAPASASASVPTAVPVSASTAAHASSSSSASNAGPSAGGAGGSGGGAGARVTDEEALIAEERRAQVLFRSERRVVDPGSRAAGWAAGLVFAMI